MRVIQNIVRQANDHPTQNAVTQSSAGFYLYMEVLDIMVC